MVDVKEPAPGPVHRCEEYGKAPPDGVPVSARGDPLQIAGDPGRMVAVGGVLILIRKPAETVPVLQPLVPATVKLPLVAPAVKSIVMFVPVPLIVAPVPV